MNFLKKICLALLCLAVLFTSCSEDEIPSGNAYTLTVSDEYDDRFEFVAFISDETGKVLDAGKTKPGRSLTLHSPKDYTGPVNIHYVTRTTLTNAFNYSINTEQDVQAGLEAVIDVVEPVEMPSNSHILDVSNISTEYDIMRHTGPTVWNKASYVSDTPGPSHLFFSSYESGPITYILQTATSGAPRYLHLNEPGEEDEADFTDFIPAEEINFNIGTQAEEITAGISALYPQGNASGLGTRIVANTDNINLYYYPISVFSGYITSIKATISDIEYTCRKYGARITEMHWLDAEISSLDVSANMLTATTTGSYDQFFVTGNNQWHADDIYYSIHWRISMKEQSSQTVALPDIITVLKKQWDELEDATISLESGTITQGSIVDNVGEVLSVRRAID